MEMSEKLLNKALRDSKVFSELSPREMMHVLITDIITRGDVKKVDFDTWIAQKDSWSEISQEERMDEVLRVLEQESPSSALQAFQRSGFAQFCLASCFPIKKLMDKKTYYKTIDNFDLLPYRKDDVAFKLALYMFSFDPEMIEATLKMSNFEDEAVEWICNMVYHYIEFLKLNNQKKLQNFVRRFGREFYYDMNDYAWAVHAITKMNELKPLKSKQYVDSMIKNGYVVDAQDLAVTEEELIEAGAESAWEVDALQQLLLDKFAKDPLSNKKEAELAYVKSLTQKDIDKKIRTREKELQRVYSKGWF